MSSSFDSQRRQEEEGRLERAAARASDRGAAPGDGDAARSVSLQETIGAAIPYFAGGGLLCAVGAGALVFVGALPAALMAGLGVGLLTKGIFVVGKAAARLETGPEADSRLSAAFDRAVESINSSVRIDAERSLELTGLLRASYEEVCKLEMQRPSLVAGLNALPADGGGDAGDSLRQAADELDARRQAFLDQCTNIQASVAMLGVNPASAESAIDQLVSATSSFGEEARAAAELEETIAAARMGRKTPAG